MPVTLRYVTHCQFCFSGPPYSLLFSVFSVTSALEILKLKPAFFPDFFLFAFPTVIYPFHRYTVVYSVHTGPYCKQIISVPGPLQYCIYRVNKLFHMSAKNKSLPMQGPHTQITSRAVICHIFSYASEPPALSQALRFAPRCSRQLRYIL